MSYWSRLTVQLNRYTHTHTHVHMYIYIYIYMHLYIQLIFAHAAILWKVMKYAAAAAVSGYLCCCFVCGDSLGVFWERERERESALGLFKTHANCCLLVAIRADHSTTIVGQVHHIRVRNALSAARRIRFWLDAQNSTVVGIKTLSLNTAHTMEFAFALWARWKAAQHDWRCLCLSLSLSFSVSVAVPVFVCGYGHQGSDANALRIIKFSNKNQKLHNP